MNKFIYANYKNIYCVIILFTIICFISVIIFKSLNLFNNITNLFLLPLIIFILFILMGNKINIKNIEIGKIDANLNLLLATIFIGDLLYLSLLAFASGRLVARNFII